MTTLSEGEILWRQNAIKRFLLVRSICSPSRRQQLILYWYKETEKNCRGQPWNSGGVLWKQISYYPSEVRRIHP